MMTRLGYDDLYRLRDTADPNLHPDGTRVAYVCTSMDRDADETRSSIWCVDLDGSPPAPLTQGHGDLHPRWSPDGRWLAFLRRGDDGPPQVWLLPTSGGEPRALTDLSLGVSGFRWAPGSDRLALLAPVDLAGSADEAAHASGESGGEAERGRRAHEPVVIRSGIFKSDGSGLIGSKRVHLFVADADTGQAEQLTKNDLNVSTPEWSPDGRSLAFSGSAADRDVAARSHLYLVSAEGGEPEEIADWEGTAVAPLFEPDGDRVVFAGAPRPGPGHTRLFAVPAGGGVPKELLPGFDRNVMLGAVAYPGALPVFADDGRLLFSARDRGCTHVYAAHNGQATKILGGADRVHSGLSHASGTIAYVVSAPDIPADVHVAAADGTDERRLTDINRELLDEVELHPSEERTFVAPDGTEIHGWLVRGDGGDSTNTPAPLLLDVHGGPHNAWNPSFLPAAHLYIEMLASEGWNVLLLNPRGSDGYGEDFLTAVCGGWGTADEQDFLSAVDTLVEEGTADPERLAVCGYSYGGYMANWLTARTDRFAAAVSGGCIADLASSYGSSDVGFWIGLFEVGAELHEARERFAEHSPLSYVEHVTAPTLILHGENDQRCPVEQAEQWFVSLRRLGREVELVRYPGASHTFIVTGRPSHRVDYSRRIVEWLTERVPS